MNALLWRLPSWVHAIAHRLTGRRLVCWDEWPPRYGWLTDSQYKELRG